MSSNPTKAHTIKDHIIEPDEKYSYLGKYWFGTKSSTHHENFSFRDRYTDYNNKCLGCVILGLIMDCKWLINRKNGEFD